MRENPYKSPSDTDLPDRVNRTAFSWKPVLYRSVQIISWCCAGIVVLGLVVMVREYRSPGQGASSQFGKLTRDAVLFNLFVWGVPVIIWLCLIHTRRIRSYFLSKTGAKKHEQRQ